MNSILAWFNPTRWLLLLALGVAVVGGGALLLHRHDAAQQEIGAAAQKKVDQAAADELKGQARELLDAETDKTRAAETALRVFIDQQELKDANNRTTVAGLERRLSAAAASHGGQLRDPNASKCGLSGGGAPGQPAASSVDRPADAAGAGGLLSVQLSDLLRAKLRRADDINIAYTACRADALTVRTVSP